MIPKTHETLERSVSQEYARLYLKTHRSITLRAQSSYQWHLYVSAVKHTFCRQLKDESTAKRACHRREAQRSQRKTP